MTSNAMIDGDNGSECSSPLHQGCEDCKKKTEEAFFVKPPRYELVYSSDKGSIKVGTKK